MVPRGATGTDCHGLSRFVMGNYFVNKNGLVMLAGRMVGAVVLEKCYYVSNPVRTRASHGGFRNRKQHTRALGCADLVVQ